MGKILYTYAGFTAQDLKNRASIPSQADITVGSNYIDCSSVDIPSEIRDIIGEGSNDLGTIYCSAKVNKWSGFGPREWYVSGGVLLDRPRSNPYDMANFCGYNHNAIPPIASPAAWNVSQTVGANLNLTPELHLREIDWQIISLTDITGVLCEVYNGTTLMASQAASFSNALVFNGSSAYFDLAFANTSTTLTIKYQFVRMTENGYAKTFLIPNIVNTPVNVTMITGGGSNLPYINDIKLGLGVYDTYPTAMLMYGDAAGNNISGSTINFTIKGIDTDADNIGDVTGVTLNVYASKNGGANINIGTIRPARSNTVSFHQVYPGGFVLYDSVVITIGD